LFLSNKYYYWYYTIINRARKRGAIEGYFEKHHVIPRCLGGKNDRRNIVRLTYREHYLAHWLLTKMTTGKDKRKMDFALIQMTLITRDKKREGIIPSRWFEKSRRLRIDVMKGNKYSVGKSNKGYKHTVEARANMSASHIGKTLPKDQIEK